MCDHHSWALSFLGEGSIIASLLSPVSQCPGPKGLSLMPPGHLVRPGSTLFQEWGSGKGVARGVCEWGAATFCGAAGFRRGLLQLNFISPPWGEGLRVAVDPAQPKPAHFPAPPQGHSLQHPLPFSATSGCCPGFRWPGGCSVHCRQVDQFPIDSFLTKCCR